MKKQISNTRRLELLMQPYLSKKDLMEFYGRGETWVGVRLREMHKKAIAEGKKPLRGIISTKRFMEYEALNLEELVKLAKIEKEVLGI